jgi:ADP-ribosyl-[dinitrogen reductase] hydrolase
LLIYFLTLYETCYAAFFFHFRFLSGDALASPTHWYYGGAQQIQSGYGTLLSDYTKPSYQLSGSILNKSNLNGGGRATNAWSVSRSGDTSKHTTIIGEVINHGKQDLWSPNQSIHYHATLKAGEPTLEVQLARVLMKSIVATNGKFDADHFRDAYIKFMTTPGSHNDTYASTCHRMFFANLIFNKLPPKDCPDNDKHNVDTMDGLVLPTIVALATAADMEATPQEIANASASCAAVTRKSTVLEQVSGVWGQLVASSIRENNDDDVISTLHSVSKQLIRRLPSNSSSRRDEMSACYLEQSLPPLVDMVAKYLPRHSQVWDILLANANCGGENVHRGSVLGAILGARAGVDQLPKHLQTGLYPYPELDQEINAFVKAVVKKTPSNDSVVAEAEPATQ